MLDPSLFISGITIACLEIALFSDNITALMAMTSTHSIQNRKILVNVALIVGTPINLLLIKVVAWLKEMPQIEQPTNLALGLALLWVFWKGWSELTSLEDDKLALEEEIHHVKIPLGQLVWIVFLLQVQSIPFYFDSVPLASTVSQSVLAIGLGITLSRLVIIYYSGAIVDFFATNLNVQWGVLLFILANGLFDSGEAIGKMTTLFSIQQLNIEETIALLVFNMIIGFATWKYIEPKGGFIMKPFDKTEGLTINILQDRPYTQQTDKT
jgi:predicted tellurium resistance membrane protein TerC